MGNETLFTMSGYEEKSLLGQNISILFTDEEEYERTGRELFKDNKGDAVNMKHNG
jgi:hypothetical protein